VEDAIARVEDAVDGLEEDELVPSMVENVGSLAKLAETPEELLQADDGVPMPATKLTCMHYGLFARKVSHQRII
jgi:hypothetical protein